MHSTFFYNAIMAREDNRQASCNAIACYRLKRLLQAGPLYITALTSSFVEGTTSKAGINDFVYWIYSMKQANSTQHNAESFFQQHETLNNALWVFPFCVLLTDFYFIGQLFIHTVQYMRKDNQQPPQKETLPHYRFREKPMLVISVYFITIASCIAEGASSAPSLASAAYQYISPCHTNTTGTCQSAERYVSSQPTILAFIVTLSLVRMGVDFITEGLECIDHWLQKPGTRPLDDAEETRQTLQQNLASYQSC